NVVHLGERECSIQRRNQKVIEEAPSPFVTPEMREAMSAEAIALAKVVDYDSAGTVEFIVDGERNFYFLEMNTRLQVEHPVTELITGVDLVEQMIRVAAGEKLALTQEDVKLNGWAIESRLYAEDPFRNFLPSTGRLTRYRPPEEGQTGDAIVRNDTGVYEGGEISINYDPMIAKLCAWAPDRDAACDAMADALDAFEVEGIGHNLPFCSAVIDHPRFRSGNITTAFIAEEYPDGFADIEPTEADIEAFAIAAVVLDATAANRGVAGPVETDATLARTVRIGRRNLPVAYRAQLGTFAVVVEGLEGVEDGASRAVTSWQPGDTLAQIEIDERSLTFKVERITGGFRLRRRGMDLRAQVLSPRVAALAELMPEKLPPDTSNMLLCPMPGLVKAIHVSVGDKVEEGQALAMVEAMKMENVLRAPKSATVSKVPAAEGDSLAVDAVIMEFEA
ncbi:MAG: biotin/lipoyl-containing protein, partial [Pseudomonadota bacterium]